MSARRLVPDVRWRRTAGEDRAMEGTAMPHYPVSLLGERIYGTRGHFFIKGTGSRHGIPDSSTDAPGAHLRGTERSTRGERTPRTGGAASGGVAVRGSRGGEVEARGGRGRAARYGEWGKSSWTHARSGRFFAGSGADPEAGSDPIRPDPRRI